MKRVLEVRSADCGPAERVSALPALYKGLLYDRRARSAALALMDSPSGAELTALRADVAVVGFSATYRGRSVLSLSEGLLDIARAGLQRLHCLNARGEDESIYLRPLEETVSSGKTWAEHLLDLYRGPWQGSLAPMWDAVEFWRE